MSIRRSPFGSRTMNSRRRQQRRKTLYEQQNGRCAKCPAPFPLKDLILRHKKHRLNGGGNTLENLHLICRTCYERGMLRTKGAHTQGDSP